LALAGDRTSPAFPPLVEGDVGDFGDFGEVSACILLSVPESSLPVVRPVPGILLSVRSRLVLGALGGGTLGLEIPAFAIVGLGMLGFRVGGAMTGEGARVCSVGGLVGGYTGPLLGQFSGLRGLLSGGGPGIPVSLSPIRGFVSSGEGGPVSSLEDRSGRGDGAL